LAHAPLHLNLDALGTNEVDTGTSMLSSAPVLPEKRLPSDSERMQEQASLARLFGGVTIPLALLALASQGRQLRILAAYTTRRLLSASRRCSWGTSDCPAGQRSVPSGWRGKSAPVKRPVFQEVAAVGGPYPETGADTAGRAGCIAACERAFAMAGANSVMRRGEG